MANSLRPLAPFVSAAPERRPAEREGDGARAATRVFTDFDALEAAYGHVLRATAQPSPFDTLEWYRCVARHGMAEGSVPRVYAADAGAGGSAFLFCRADPAQRRLASLGNFFTMDYGPAFAPGTADRAALTCTLARFVADERPRWRAVNFQTLLETDPRTDFLEDAFRRAGFAVHRHLQSLNRYQRLGGMDFDGYLAARPSRLRNTIRRREKKLGQDHHVTIAIERDHSESLIDDYDRVYEKSWKEPEIYPRFVREFCRAAGQMGILRLAVLYVDERPAAAQIWLVYEAKAIIYKLAYDEAFKDYSVGSILTREVLRKVMAEEKLERLDYGVGIEPYKRDWMDEEQRIFGIEAANPRTLGGLVLAARSLAGDALRPIRARLARRSAT